VTRVKEFSTERVASLGATEMPLLLLHTDLATLDALYIVPCAGAPFAFERQQIGPTAVLAQKLEGRRLRWRTLLQIAQTGVASSHPESVDV
jgi:hypothetical protein